MHRHSSVISSHRNKHPFLKLTTAYIKQNNNGPNQQQSLPFSLLVCGCIVIKETQSL